MSRVTTRKAPESRRGEVATRSERKPAVGVRLASPASSASSVSSFTAAGPGVKVIDNGAYFGELTKLLAGAKTSIDIVQYNFFSESGNGKQIAQQLIELKKKNPALQIRLFIEADHGDGAARNQKTMKLLEAAGIEVVPDSDNIVTHAKGVCVDSRYVLAGSHNLSNTWMGKNNEVSLSLDSPELAKAYEQYFERLVKDPRGCTRRR